MNHSGKFPCGGLFLFLTLLWMGLVTSACTKNLLPVCHPNYYRATDSKAITTEISRLETAIAKSPGRSGESASYFNLALLYAHYNNPTPDYHRSLDMLGKYLSLNPGNSSEEALYLKALLQRLVESERERARYKKETKRLEQNITELREKNDKQVLENRNLQEAIEKLKLLDRQLEETRLIFK